jgi:hypothetical protein
MAILQIYESTIFSETTAHAFHLLVVPGRSFVGQQDLNASGGLASDLGLVKLGPAYPDNLMPSIAALLQPEDSGVSVLESLLAAMRSQVPSPWSGISPPPPLAATDSWTPEYAFAEQVAGTPMIPFENSPLTSESLINLLNKVTASSSGGVALGAYAGFVLAGSTPFLLLYIPAGMLIFGAAAGLGKALEEGLRVRLLKVLKGAKS